VIKDVPRSVVEARKPSLPFILHGLLQHEHKQSVLHFVVQRNTEYTEPVKAKVRTLPNRPHMLDRSLTARTHLSSVSGRDDTLFAQSTRSTSEEVARASIMSTSPRSTCDQEPPS
jgi:hypothetical protein